VKGRTIPYWKLLAFVPLFTGIALIVHVVTTISLGLALIFLGVIVATASWLVWRRLPDNARQEILHRVGYGAIAGAAATPVYDLSRLIIVNLFHTAFWPFDIFPIFGQAIAGPQISFSVATTVGVVYHYANGIFFAIAYAIVFASRPWWTGILWALGLEALMLSIYPGWLHPKAFGEFVSISMFGHVAYGITLGAVTYLLWRRARQHNIAVPAR
jgi:hypothetical protein